MLTNLALENFKVFEKRQSLKIGKKFTLIYIKYPKNETINILYIVSEVIL